MANPVQRNPAADVHAAQDAREIAQQHCTLFQNLITAVGIIALAVFGALLIMEWPILSIPVGVYLGVKVYDCIMDFFGRGAVV